MKNTLLLITILIASGCGADKQTLESKNTAAKIEDMEVEIKRLEEENRKLKAKAEAYEKALRDSVVGEYERGFRGTIAKQRLVFQENGKVERSSTYGEDAELNWEIVDGEIHMEGELPKVVLGGRTHIKWAYKINKDISITRIASIDKDGKRTDLLTDGCTSKKIK